MTPGLASELRANPFFALAPTWWSRLVLIGLSTLASLIGSQAVISGAFSVLEQSMQLDMLPRLSIVRTSKVKLVYVPGAFVTVLV